MILKSFFKKVGAGRKERRRHYRVVIKDLHVSVRGGTGDVSLTVKDVSTGGVAVLSRAKALKPGTLFRLDITRNGQTVCAGLLVKVVRSGDGVVGCCFVRPDKKQEATLHELVLEEQKRRAASRRGTGECAADMEGEIEFIDRKSVV